jgi:hypothetical protein
LPGKAVSKIPGNPAVNSTSTVDKPVNVLIQTNVLFGTLFAIYQSQEERRDLKESFRPVRRQK